MSNSKPAADAPADDSAVSRLWAKWRVNPRQFAGRNARQIFAAIADDRQWRGHACAARLGALNRAVERDAARALGSLATLNHYLKAFGLKHDFTNRKKARAHLKRKVFINIYDLREELFARRCKSLAELRAYTIANNLVFPLKRAKDDGLRDFLQVIFE